MNLAVGIFEEGIFSDLVRCQRRMYRARKDLALSFIAGLSSWQLTTRLCMRVVHDQNMINWIDQTGPLYLKSPLPAKWYVLLLSSINHFKLHPRQAWYLTPSFMHLETFCFTLPVLFWCFSLLGALLGRGSQIHALFAAFFFALHPLATESVCWISGRTYFVMAFFILLAVWLSSIALELKVSRSVVHRSCLCLAGLAKEVAVSPYLAYSG